VASFARFTLHLVHAISSQFSKVRSFVFIDGSTSDAVLRGVDDPAEAVHRSTRGGRRLGRGHSDYGSPDGVGSAGARDHEDEHLLLGDARNNYTRPALGGSRR